MALDCVAEVEDGLVFVGGAIEGLLESGNDAASQVSIGAKALGGRMAQKEPDVAEGFSWNVLDVNLGIGLIGRLLKHCDGRDLPLDQAFDVRDVVDHRGSEYGVGGPTGRCFT